MGLGRWVMSPFKLIEDYFKALDYIETVKANKVDAKEALNSGRAEISKPAVLNINGQLFQVRKCNAYITYFTGDPELPGGVDSLRLGILINDALLDMGMDCVKAVIMHEQGHRMLGHNKDINGRNTQKEIDADNYAIERGFGEGIKKTLEVSAAHSRKYVLKPSEELCARLENVRSYLKAA
jgi:hypothetical protein